MQDSDAYQTLRLNSPAPPRGQEQRRPTIGDHVTVISGDAEKATYIGHVSIIDHDDKSSEEPYKLKGIDTVHFKQSEIQLMERDDSAAPLVEKNAAGEIATEDDVVAAKLIGFLNYKNRKKVAVEHNSVYGAALLMPQLGRSLGWPNDIISLTMSSYCHYIMYVILHATLLALMMKEEVVMDGFAGQMYVCDFGKNMDTCSGDACLGPAGTKMTPPRLYNWDQYATRGFVVDSMKTMFPHKADFIAEHIDAGEYGIESYWCRVICILVFMISIQEELDLVLNMFRLLWYVPNKNESWTVHNNDEEDCEIVDHWEMEVKVQIAGMSRGWKAWNLFFIFVPKIMLWWRTAVAGTDFLMETSSIDGIIVNSVALGFLLSFDDIITDNLMSVQENFLLDKVEDFTYDRDSFDELLTHQQALTNVAKQRFHPGKIAYDFFGYKLHKMMMVFSFTGGLIYHYYLNHCDYKDGRWVSKDMHQPSSMRFTFFNAFLHEFFPVPTEEERYWTYDH